MGVYGGKQMAESFRGVRANTITLAEEIPEESYGFKPTPEVMTVAQQLAHLAVSNDWQIGLHGEGISEVDFGMFSTGMARAANEEQALTSKPAIVAALRERGEAMAAFLEGLSDERLAETVSFPPPVQPSRRTRFEMLLSIKEHEMHHRAQLMVYQRLLGIVPHLTRRRAERMAAGAASGASARS